MEVVKAQLSVSKRTPNKQFYKLRNEEFGIEVERIAPVTWFCRELISQRPELEGASLEVYRGDDLSFTVKHIGKMSKKVLIETEKKLKYKTFKPFDWTKGE
jgi:hypothetical protein